MDVYTGIAFTPAQHRMEFLTQTAVRHAPKGVTRVLDLGCGTGTLTFQLAAALPDARVVGMDISEPSIATARVDAVRSPHASRVEFHAADYMAFTAEPFDLIISWGVLNCIPGSTVALAEKLSRDLKPGGVFVNGMPYECAHNACLTLLRKALATVRSPLMDRMILGLATTVHRGEFSSEQLAERLIYMYLPPERLDGIEMRREFSARGLVVVEELPERASSFAQMRSRVAVFHKRAVQA